MYVVCKHCGYKDLMKPTSIKDALILETVYNNSSKRQGVSQINEFTIQDPTLPHIKTIPCPNTECKSQEDPSMRDILYIKTDAKELKFQYLCTICKTEWGS